MSNCERRSKKCANICGVKVFCTSPLFVRFFLLASEPFTACTAFFLSLSPLCFYRKQEIYVIRHRWFYYTHWLLLHDHMQRQALAGRQAGTHTIWDSIYAAMACQTLSSNSTWNQFFFFFLSFLFASMCLSFFLFLFLSFYFLALNDSWHSNATRAT